MSDSGRRNLASFLDDLGREPARPAFALRTPYRSFRWSAGRVRGTALSLAARLGAAGVQPGERVLLQGPNSPAWCAALLGIVARGAVAVPLDAGAPPEFAGRVARRVGARAALVGGESLSGLGGLPVVERLDDLATAAHVDPLPEPHRAAPDDTAEIVFTSGTTAEPRGVELSHANLLASLERIERGFRKRDWYLRPLLPMRLLCLVPLSHLFGQSLGLFLPVMLRSTGLFVTGLQPPRVLRAIRADAPLAVIAVPRTLAALRSEVARQLSRTGRLRRFEHAMSRTRGRSFWRRVLAARDVRSVVGWRTWVVVVGGARLDEVLEDFWSGCGFAVIEGYGMTEAAPIVAVHNPLDGARHTLGRPIPGVEVKLADDGEVLVRGPNVMKGYFGDPEASREVLDHGWLRTGDLGGRDEQGRLYFRGRKKDVVVTAGGMNVFPADVEAVLRSLDGVRDAVVIGVPGAAGEDEVGAAVLAESTGADADELRARANERLQSHQRLRRLVIWRSTDFPRTATGKVRRGIVAAAVRSGAHSDAERSVPRVARILERLRVEGGLEDATRADPLDLDSLETVELLGELEEELGVALDDRALGRSPTVGDLGRLVAGHGRDRVRIEMPRWSRRAPARGLRALARLVVVRPLFRLFVRLRVDTTARDAPLPVPCIVVANHTSPMDVPAILAALPPRLRRRLCPAMAIENLPEHFDPAGAGIWRRLRASLLYKLAVLVFNAYPLPQRRGFRPSLEYTGELLDAGLCPLVFPEGRMTRTGRMQPFKSGIGLLALETRARIVPVRVRGLGEILPPGGRWPRRGRASLTVGPGFDPLDEGAAEPAAVAARIERAVRELPAGSPGSATRAASR